MKNLISNIYLAGFNRPLIAKGERSDGSIEKRGLKMSEGAIKTLPCVNSAIGSPQLQSSDKEV